MTRDEEIELMYKIRKHREKIFKRGTYTFVDPNQPEPNPQGDMNMAMAAESQPEEPVDEMAMDDATRAIYETIMPTRMEDAIQSSINALVEEKNPEQEEQDAKVAEIMKKYQSNIADNVASLFENN